MMVEDTNKKNIRICTVCGKTDNYKYKKLCRNCYRKNQVETSPLIPCECGCGELIHSIIHGGTKRRFVNGHHQIGEKNFFWNGGRTIHNGGYVFIWKTEHPFCNSKGYVMEHRLVMEKKIGRYLTKEEVVHHMDGNPSNNSESNLQLFEDNSKHITFELKKDLSDRFCLKCGSKTTYVHRNGHADWYVYETGFMCNKCYNKEYKRKI